MIQINSTTPSHKEFKSPQQMRDWLGGHEITAGVCGAGWFRGAGRAYAAKTTPQMVLIDPAGTVIYNGAIDDKRSANVADIPLGPAIT